MREREGISGEGEAVRREEIRMEGAMLEVVYIFTWASQEGDSRVSVLKIPAVM